MKTGILIVILIVALSVPYQSLAAENMFETDASMLASDEDIERLKNDFLTGELGVNKTRVKDIRNNYGDPMSVIVDTEKRLSYDYNGAIKIEFDKNRFLREWDYDSFKKPVYTDDVDDLRYDLESKTDLVGDFVAFTQVRRSYGEPTESHETDEDGKMSVYYYGDIKLVFENVYLVRKYQIKNISDSKDPEVLETK